MAAITVNVEQEDKELFNTICNKMGMNISTAINIFIKKVNATRSIPFPSNLNQNGTKKLLQHVKKHLIFQKAESLQKGMILGKRLLKT